MDNNQKRQQIIETLISLSNDRGFVTSDDIVKTADTIDLRLDDIDRICGVMIERGIIVRDDEDASDKVDSEDLGGYISGYSKIDYAEIFRRVLQIDESLSTYINELKQILPPRKGEEKQLIYQAKHGNKYARDRLISMFLKVSVRMALHYHDRWGYPLADMIQAGNLGLIYAVEKFDYRRGHKFSTYAPWLIRQVMNRTIADDARTIRIPVHMVETINKLLMVSHKLAQEYGREPTAAEIGEEMEISPEKVREILKVEQLPVSLESSMDEEEDNYLSDFIEDRNALPPDEVVSKKQIKEEIGNVLLSLTPREQRVLELRFGLEDGRSRTLEEVGNEFGVTRERIRQIEAKALRRLRHPSRSRRLKNYLEDTEA